jgi:hypothetical protein
VKLEPELMRPLDRRIGSKAAQSRERFNTPTARNAQEDEAA